MYYFLSVPQKNRSLDRAICTSCCLMISKINEGNVTKNENTKHRINEIGLKMADWFKNG